MARGFGGSPVDRLQLEQGLEARLQPLVRSFDSDAVVYVRATLAEQAEKISLPGTPFEFREISSGEGQSTRVLQKLEIRVLTQKKQLPEPLVAILRDISQGFGGESEIQTLPLPPELQEAARVAQSQRTEAEARVLGQILRERKELQEQRSPAAVMAAGADPGLVQEVLTFGVGAGLLLLVLNLVSLWLRKRWGRSVQSSLESGFRELKGALQETGELRRAGSATAAALPVEGPRGGVQPEMTAGEGSVGDLSVTGLSALLSDCYWSAQDGVGAWLWKRIPMALRRDVVETQSYLAKYAQHLAMLPADPGRYLGIEQDSSYLDPMPIGHLSNAALAQVVRQRPGVLKRLSVIRLDALDLGIAEKVELLRKANQGADASFEELSQLQPSAARVLERRIWLEPRTIEEEREAIELGTRQPELRASIPSLAWLARLPADQLSAILRQFSAQELSQAWMGPPEILEALGAALPEKKRRLLDSYQGRVMASRDSQVFRALHRLSLSEPAKGEEREAA